LTTHKSIACEICHRSWLILEVCSDTSARSTKISSQACRLCAHVDTRHLGETTPGGISKLVRKGIRRGGRHEIFRCFPVLYQELTMNALFRSSKVRRLRCNISLFRRRTLALLRPFLSLRTGHTWIHSVRKLTNPIIQRISHTIPVITTVSRRGVSSTCDSCIYIYVYCRCGRFHLSSNDTKGEARPVPSVSRLTFVFLRRMVSLVSL
jgi:hypothetical protein